MVVWVGGVSVSRQAPTEEEVRQFREWAEGFIDNDISWEGHGDTLDEFGRRSVALCDFWLAQRDVVAAHEEILFSILDGGMLRGEWAVKVRALRAAVVSGTAEEPKLDG